jgi:hypothetical protein
MFPSLLLSKEKYHRFAGRLAIALTVMFSVWLPAATGDPILGTWKLNRARSKYIPGPAPRSQTRIYKETPDGIFVTIETIDANGKPQPPIVFSEKYDGKDYPITGSTVGDALALKRINDYVSEATMKHAGKVVATTRRLITDNGKTLILIYQETDSEHPVDNIIVYDRQ